MTTPDARMCLHWRRRLAAPEDKAGRQEVLAPGEEVSRPEAFASEDGAGRPEVLADEARRPEVFTQTKC